MSRLAIIAARSQSKGLPGKNIKMFAGRPLLAHSIVQAKNSGQFDCVACSSDDERYLAIAMEAGADLAIKRPEELASDLAAKLPVLRHAVTTAEAHAALTFDTVVDLQPTSPLRRPEDIPGAIAQLEANPQFENVVSVCAAADSPYYTLVEMSPAGVATLSKVPPGGQQARRQDIPSVWRLNGSIYAWRRAALWQNERAVTAATGIWVMPDVCGFDIDLALDFALAAYVAEHEFGWPATPR